MWEQKLFELFITGIPQGFAFVLLFFTLANINIRNEKVLYVISSILYAVLAFIIRPYVNFGVHSVILLIVMVIIAVVWGKVNILISSMYGVVTYIVAYLCEWVTFLILGLFKFNMQLLDTDPKVRTVIGFIPLAFLFSIGFIVYYSKKRARKAANKNGV